MLMGGDDDDTITIGGSHNYALAYGEAGNDTLSITGNVSCRMPG